MGLKAFCEQARSLRPPVPITVETITIKAKNLSEKLLNLYEQHPTTIEAEEVDLLKKMQFSSKWAFNWLKRNDFTSRLLHGEAGDVDVTAIADDIAKLKEEISNYVAPYLFAIRSFTHESVFSTT